MWPHKLRSYKELLVAIRASEATLNTMSEQVEARVQKARSSPSSPTIRVAEWEAQVLPGAYAILSEGNPTA